MDSNPIKYSDLIQDDGAIRKAIEDIRALESTFKDAIVVIRAMATDMQNGMKAASGATEGNRQAIRKTAEEANRLERVIRELMYSQDELGKQETVLRMLISDSNRETRTKFAVNSSAADSYNKLSAQLKVALAEYKALSKEEALNSEIGQAKLKQILKLKEQILEYTNAMKLEKKAEKESSTSKKEAKVVVTELEKARKKLAYASSEENSQLLLLAQQTREANQVAKLQAIIANEVEGSYNRLSAQYSLNKIELNKMSAAQRDNSVAGRKLVADTNAIYQEMKKLQEATGKHTLSVGNYRRAWDGLGMSVNQIMREVPAAGISLNTFFLAISNNVPILVDEIQKVSAANKEAAAAGKATVNITKSVLKAIFSWQSMLVIIITVLSMYGKQIFEWIGQQFKAKAALDQAAAAARGFNQALLDGRKSAQQDLVRLKLLYGATTDVTKSMTYRKKALDEIRKQYPAYFKNMSDEQILAGKAADEYIRLAGAILKAAMSRAAEKKIVENSEKLLEIDEKLARAKSLEYHNSVVYNKAKRAAAAAQEAENASALAAIRIDQKGSSAGLLLNEAAKKKAWEDSKQAVSDLVSEQNVLLAINERLTKKVDVSSIIDDPKKGKSDRGPREPRDRTEQIERENLEIIKKYAEAVTALNRDEIKKRKDELIDAYNVETAALMNKYNNDKDMTEDSKRKILATTALMYLELRNKLEEADLDMQERTLSVQEETLKLRLEATREGSTEENAIRIQLMEVGRQKELLENSRLIESKRQNESDINAKWDNIILKQNAEFQADYEMQMFNIAQDIEQAEFESTRRTEYEKTKFKLEQERARWQMILELAKKYNALYSAEQIAAMEAMIKSLTGQLNELGSKGYDFYSMLGFNPSDEYREGMQQIVNQTIDNIRAILDAQVQAAEISVNKAEDRVNATKSVLQAEIDARNAGYASNVAQAQKDLDLERKTLDKAQKEKAKAVKAQQALDTIMQTSSLITATAQIFSSLSGIPIVGWALAIAAVAAMWGTFAVSKVKAAQMAKQSYGEGGYEFLEGGSHASGNDIPIGETSDGKQRRAEGGEMLAVIRRTQTRKYKRILPDIIDSLNKGIFEQKYMRSYDSGNFAFSLQSNTDLKTLEADVRAIKEQGERKLVTDGAGNTIELYKNLKRVYR